MRYRPCDPASYLYVGVFAPGRPRMDRLIGLLRAATEDLLLPSLTCTDHELHLLAIRRGEDLSRERRLHGVVWDVVTAKEPLEDVMITAARRADGEVDADGQLHAPPFLSVHARPPGPCRRLDGSWGETETVVDLSVRLAEIGSGIPPDLPARVVAWVAQATRTIGAVTGYAIVGDALAGPVSTSPYEMAVSAPAAERDARRTVIGFGWGTLLGTDHVARLGGPEALEHAPVHRRLALGGGSWWLELAADPCEVSRGALGALRDFLAPVLPEGTRSAEDLPAW